MKPYARLLCTAVEWVSAAANGVGLVSARRPPVCTTALRALLVS